MTDTKTASASQDTFGIYRQDIEHYQLEVMARLDQQMQLSGGALKTLTLINGGAILALLTFAGNAKGSVAIDPLRWAFGLFIAGLLFALLSYLGGFMAQGCYMVVTSDQRSNALFQMLGSEPPHDLQKDLRKGNIWISFAITAAVASFAAFGCGAMKALVSLA